MLAFLKQVRHKTLSSNKLSIYILYALGEIFLVVVGILIAVSIDNYNESIKIQASELESYGDIVADLKKDSVHFAGLIADCKIHLEMYYHIFGEIQGQNSFSGEVYYDILGVSREVAPRTEQNHQSTIERLTNKEARNLLNDYFFRQRIMTDAVAEFNKIVVDEARPYLFGNGIIDPKLAFHDNVYGFLPEDGLLVNYATLQKFYSDPMFSNILATQRVSMGHMLSELKKISKQNHELVEYLESKKEN